jgi:TonB-dependent starch-binding outer membrane protein SusC
MGCRSTARISPGLYRHLSSRGYLYDRQSRSNGDSRATVLYQNKSVSDSKHRVLYIWYFNVRITTTRDYRACCQKWSKLVAHLPLYNFLSYLASLMKKTLLLFALTLLSTSIVLAQTITGTVTDALTNEVLVGASIQIKGSNRGTTTDLEGKYKINISQGDVLVVRYTGYTPYEVAAPASNTLDIALESTASTLEDVVVVGYGVQKKSQITGAIASISNKDFKDQPVSNLAQSIQGRVTGLNAMSPSGTPGGGLLVSVRGNNAPLYVVDGIPLLAESQSALSTSFDLQGASVGSGQTLSSISDINPNDIERIEVLKDASAAAIYGARAANGVILITTKRGQAGKSEVNFNAYTGIQQVSRPIEFMSSEQFVELIEEARRNDLAIYQSDPAYFGDGFDPSVLTEPLENFDLSSGQNTNWLNEITRTAPINNYELSLRGGSDKTRFFTSAGWFDQQGILIENFYKRFTYRLNLDHDLNSKVTVGTSLNTSYSRNRRSFNDNTYTGIITNALGASPLMPALDEAGDYARFEDYQVNWLSDNPVKSAREIRAFTNTYRLLGTTYLEWKVLPTLKWRSTFSTDAVFVQDNQFKSPITADAEAFGGEALEAGFRNLTWLSEHTLSYTTAMGKNNLSAVGGATFQRTTLNRSAALGQGFPPGGLERVSSAANILSAVSVGSGFGLVSYLGRVNYDYDNRYLITASFRADGSSRFAKDNRYGVFPSAAVAWRVSSEPFFTSGLITDLKVRASYGLTGDQEIGDFQNTIFYAPSRYDGQPGLQIRNIADPNLSWQSNRMLNLGIDYELVSGRFGGSVEFFKSNKLRLLSEDIVPGTTGFATVTRNSGEVQNLGVEANLRASVLSGRALRWEVNFNTTWIRNEIRALTSDGVLLNAYSDLEATHILQVGQPIASFWGLKYTGVDPQTGDVTFEDTNGDGVVDFDDAQIIGNAMPDWFGGLTNSLQYKQWDLSVFARYSVGNQVYNLIRATTENLGWSNEGGLSSVYANNTTRVLDRWRQPGDQAEFGRASFVYQNSYQNSSQFVENASFLRLQNITLGYTIPQGRRMHGTRLYVEAQNAYVLTRYSGFDPEVSSNGGLADRTAGVDYGAYPQARTFLVGINLKL